MSGITLDPCRYPGRSPTLLVSPGWLSFLVYQAPLSYVAALFSESQQVPRLSAQNSLLYVATGEQCLLPAPQSPAGLMKHTSQGPTKEVQTHQSWVGPNSSYFQQVPRQHWCSQSNGNSLRSSFSWSIFYNVIHVLMNPQHLCSASASLTPFPAPEFHMQLTV